MNLLSSKIGYLDPIDFDEVYSKLYEFFKMQKNFRCAHAQSLLTILGGCQNPDQITVVELGNQKWPLPQTTLYSLEIMMMALPEEKGFFNLSTSYRNQKEIVMGTDHLVYPHLDYVFKGNLEALIQFNSELLTGLGYDSFTIVTYEDVCKKYETEALTQKHEDMICRDFGAVVLLIKDELDKVNQVDVILHGHKTIQTSYQSNESNNLKKIVEQSAESSIIKQILGHERLTQEVNEFMSLPLIDRCSGEINLNHLVRSMKLQGLV